MSYPINPCQILTAAQGDIEDQRFLRSAMEYNLQCGHYSVGLCRCGNCESNQVLAGEYFRSLIFDIRESWARKPKVEPSKEAFGAFITPNIKSMTARPPTEEDKKFFTFRE
jgi:hypothetical protein